MSEFNSGFDGAGVKLAHHFGDDGSGVYIKETVIPAGVALSMHEHTHAHKSVLCCGTAVVTIGGKARTVIGPAVLSVQRGIAHSVDALTDCVWLCVHATDETDPDRIDHTLTEG